MNENMPPRSTPEYLKERRRRMAEGTWVSHAAQKRSHKFEVAAAIITLANEG